MEKKSDTEKVFDTFVTSKNDPLKEITITDKDFYADLQLGLDLYNCPNCRLLDGLEAGPTVMPKFSYCPYCGVKLIWDIKKRSKNGVSI